MSQLVNQIDIPQQQSPYCFKKSVSLVYLWTLDIVNIIIWGESSLWRHFSLNLFFSLWWSVLPFVTCHKRNLFTKGLRLSSQILCTLQEFLLLEKESACFSLENFEKWGYIVWDSISCVLKAICYETSRQPKVNLKHEFFSNFLNSK